MDINVFLGLILAVFSFYFGVPDLQVNIGTYIDGLSLLLVAGGTIASTLTSTSLKQFMGLMVAFRQLFFSPKKVQPVQAVEKLVEISEHAQKVSKQELGKYGDNFGDGFLERGLGLVGAGLSKDFVQRTLETDIAEIRRRHDSNINVVKNMATFAPMFGMAGTVLGVTQVLQNVTDIETIVAGMSLALLTTLYGVILSAVLFTPLANKLKAKSDAESTTKQIILEGTLMIMDKEIPLKVEKSLLAFLEGKLQKKKAS